MSKLNKLNQILALYLVMQDNSGGVSKFNVNTMLWARAQDQNAGYSVSLVNGDQQQLTIECVNLKSQMNYRKMAILQNVQSNL